MSIMLQKVYLHKRIFEFRHHDEMSAKVFMSSIWEKTIDKFRCIIFVKVYGLYSSVNLKNYYFMEQYKALRNIIQM